VTPRNGRRDASSADRVEPVIECHQVHTPGRARSASSCRQRTRARRLRSPILAKGSAPTSCRMSSNCFGRATRNLIAVRLNSGWRSYGSPSSSMADRFLRAAKAGAKAHLFEVHGVSDAFQTSLPAMTVVGGAALIRPAMVKSGVSDREIETWTFCHKCRTVPAIRAS